jgi:hypothetical protein
VAKGTFPTIVLTAHPQGKFLEGVVSGTPLPGTIMQIVGGTAQQEERFTWQSANLAASGNWLMQAVLREDDNQGGTASTAYVSGTRCEMYVPISGEEMNCLYGLGSGTSNSLTPGTNLMVSSGQGILITSTGSPQQIAWMSYDTLTSVAADTLAWVVRI